MLTSNALGYSVYVSTWDAIKDKLSSRISEGSFIFTSLHIEEEMQLSDYPARVDAMLRQLKRMGYQILVDVSPRTLTALSMDSFETLVEKYEIDTLRCDFGFSLDTMLSLTQSCSICINASMSDYTLTTLLKHAKHPIIAMHNFYPRPETGLDLEQLRLKNKLFQDHHVEVLAFIPSDVMKRGPLFEGLPTCESHRTMLPLSALIELKQCGVDKIVVGDGILSDYQTQLCQTYLNETIISVSVKFNHRYSYLYGQKMTIRSDSPSKVCRCLESRRYATQGQIIEPCNTIQRYKGSITIDNVNYLRYSGEIQILKEEFKADNRVNVIGRVSDESILALIQPGSLIRFVKDVGEE